MTLRTSTSLRIGTIICGFAGIVACSDGARTAITAPSPATASAAASPNADAQSIRGSAEVTQMPGVTYGNTIEARLNAAGEASGTLVVHILDLSGFGVSDGKATLVSRIDCLEFAGDSVWFGAQVVSSSRKDLLDPSLTASIGQVKIASGKTYLFSGPALFYTAPGTTCKDRPTLPIQPVNSGGFEIR